MNRGTTQRDTARPTPHAAIMASELMRKFVAGTLIVVAAACVGGSNQAATTTTTSTSSSQLSTTTTIATTTTSAPASALSVIRDEGRLAVSLPTQGRTRLVLEVKDISKSPPGKARIVMTCSSSAGSAFPGTIQPNTADRNPAPQGSR